MISADGMDLLRAFEGLRLLACQDQHGVWTVGYGHTRGVREGDRVTEDVAGKLLQLDVSYAEHGVYSALREKGVAMAVPPAPSRYAALVCLCFNIGPLAFLGSTVLERHVEGDFASAADAFLLWNKVTIVDHQGLSHLVVNEGLERRRGAERALYLK